MKRLLFLDQDDVMADFTGALPAEYRVKNGRLPKLQDDAMWAHINARDTFFRDLQPCPGALDFFESIRHLEPIMLTACSSSNYIPVAGQKRAWTREHLGPDVMVLPAPAGKFKPLFMHAPGDVLIDDYGRNIDLWNEAGGIGILHDGDFVRTARLLQQVWLAPTCADLVAMGALA